MVSSAYLIEASWSLLLVAALVLLNGFFVAAEFAIVKVRMTQLASGDKGGRPAHASARHVVEHLDAYLSACQLGITMASLGLGWLGEPAVAHLIVEPLLGGYLTDPETIRGLSFGVAFFIIMALHIVIGELAPKSLAIRKPRSTTLAVAFPLRVFRTLFFPVIWGLNGSANLLIRLVGFAPVTSGEAEHTIEELRLLLAHVPSGEKTQRRSAQVANRAFALQDLEVRDIMVPRDRIVCVDVTKTFEENLRIVKDQPFTRFPLADGGPDSILGFVHQRDIFAAAEQAPRPPLENLRREVVVLPTTQRVSAALFEMLEKRRQMAIVVNEFGITVGLLTLEDIFEELVGDIPSDFGRAEASLRVVAPGHYLVDASMPLHELQVVLREPLEHVDASTLAGLLIQKMGRIPGKGEVTRIGNYSYFVKEADRNRIRMVEIRRTEEGPSGKEKAAKPRGKPAP